MDLRTRRGLIGSKAERPNKYVKNGLALWLDGIDKGGTPDVWTDLIGGYQFTPINGVTFNSDNVELDGNNQFLHNEDFTCPRLETATIEVVCSGAKSTQVLFASKNNSLCFGFYYINSTVYVIRGMTVENNRKINPVLEPNGSFSFSDVNQLRNGKQASEYTENNFNASNQYNYIGRRNSGSYFNGKIYCVRIYNRKLTVQEALRNYQVDRSRFSLFQN